MTGWKPSLFVKAHVVVMLSTVAPIVIAILLYKDVAGMIVENEHAMGKYIFPKWATWLGWCMALIPLSAIPFGVLHHFLTARGSLWEKTKSGFRCTDLFRQNAELQSAISKRVSNITPVPSDYPLDKSKEGIVSTHFSYVNQNNNGLVNPAFN